MIEVIYSGETREPKAQEKGILAALKNIRQIGNAGKTKRIYVEDCVMGFLERQMQKKDPVVAALLGKESQENGVTYIFVNGALLPEGIKVKGETLDFSSQAFLDLYEEAESYFPEREILGWYLPAYEMIGKYGASLGQNSRLFLLEDPTESEEIFYLWEQNHLSKQGGYYIYYQRNEEMKAYMQKRKERTEENVSKRKTWAVVEGSGDVAEREQGDRIRTSDKIQKGDRISKNTETARQKSTVRERQKGAFGGESSANKKPNASSVKNNTTARNSSKVRDGAVAKSTWKEALKSAFEKKEYEEFVDDYEEMESSGVFEISQPKLTTFLYGASTVLAIVVLVIGITLINNYEKMYEMQEAIETIAMTITEVQNAEGENAEMDSNGGGKRKTGAVPDSQQSMGNDGETEGSRSADGQESGQVEVNESENQQIEEKQTGGAEKSQRDESGQADEAEVTGGQDAEATTAQASQEDTEPRYYVIQEGDTLASISRKMYQSTDKIEEIKQLNEGIKENELNVGQKIILP